MENTKNSISIPSDFRGRIRWGLILIIVFAGSFLWLGSIGVSKGDERSVIIIIIGIAFLGVGIRSIIQAIMLKHQIMLYFDENELIYMPHSKKQVGPIKWENITSIEYSYGRNARGISSQDVFLTWKITDGEKLPDFVIQRSFDNFMRISDNILGSDTEKIYKEMYNRWLPYHQEALQKQEEESKDRNVGKQTERKDDGN